ncbi:GNAT family N-acetyltransferase [Mycolicibacterium celeriflavum]|uniref:N-acetyltransferase n=1 Tax=Mycolicibacterium celeriflavum TaxID=1249101 RepID=A0A1X0BXL5_MYCCF|nr:GNAT family N-acetyltransferase [Mycolicibacterium celeriflavum]MCV7237227.1 GNAT family N-acetyltransferase [Mycolicibacterium celeriflavum]ORA49180.1 GNAT family N-acetyltransferase [Mycolicibacterium celeriflavum]BBY41923.1 N-acetyltransferase [Mycolicibacterium celeriflavum]
MADVEVAPARRRDVRTLSEVLGRAFYQDPVMRWMLPDDATRARGLTRMFATMTRHHFLRTDAVEVAGGERIGAAALWAPPGQWKQGRLEELLMMPGFIRAFGSRVRRGQQVSELMKQHHPEEPHWYLAVIGSDPTVRGTGFGQALMRSRLDRCDAEYAPAYLESSNPDNIPYYQRFGFEVTGEITLPDGGPSMWPMWRNPR